jgi:elongator complex protein 3
MIKIYPTLVIKGTKLYTWWMTGDYAPLTTEHALDLVTKMKEFVPKWVRIMRVQRDIPSPLIEAGVNKSNLRQLIHEELIRQGSKCNCIRCREVGQQKAEPEPENLKLMKEIYEASGGLENFISFEDMETNTLVGFIRLRIPSQESHRVEIESNSALIRELHVYGPMIPVGSKSDESWQHKGWGRKLLYEAERMALEEYDIQRLLVLSALGTKEYYSNLGYERDGVYMAKSL